MRRKRRPENGNVRRSDVDWEMPKNGVLTDTSISGRMYTYIYQYISVNIKSGDENNVSEKNEEIPAPVSSITSTAGCYKWCTFLLKCRWTASETNRYFSGPKSTDSAVKKCFFGVYWNRNRPEKYTRKENENVLNFPWWILGFSRGNVCRRDRTGNR